jgi:protein SCO1/2
MIKIKRFVTLAVLAVSTLGTLAGSAWAAPMNSPWGANYFPNVPLQTQDGKTVRFYDDLIKDKKVLINFTFTHCDDGCPLDTANMLKVQKLLGSRMGKEIFMYSITLDPERDTPTELKEYADLYGVGPGWQFLTGTRESIDAIRAKFGDTGKMTEHANTVRMGDDPRGLWMSVPLNTNPDYIAAEILNSFDPGWSSRTKLRSIADAPKTEIFGAGQLLFVGRCASCHTFGKGNELGPDLKGVTNLRERNWLRQYLAEPNKMRAAKDPIALELAKRNKVLMPQLNLTHEDLENLLLYMEAQDAVGVKPEATKTVVAPGAAGGEKPAVVAHDHQQHSHAGAQK